MGNWNGVTEKSLIKGLFIRLSAGWTEIGNRKWSTLGVGHHCHPCAWKEGAERGPGGRSAVGRGCTFWSRIWPLTTCHAAICYDLIVPSPPVSCQHLSQLNPSGCWRQRSPLAGPTEASLPLSRWRLHVPNTRTDKVPLVTEWWQGAGIILTPQTSNVSHDALHVRFWSKVRKENQVISIKTTTIPTSIRSHETQVDNLGFLLWSLLSFIV